MSSVCYLGLFWRRIQVLSVDHAEGDALGFGGEDPADHKTRMCSSYENDTVTAGPDEELSGLIAKLNHVLHTERHRQPVKQNTMVNK